jgi:transketolase
VAEEHNTHGGVASVIADAMVDAELRDTRLVRIGLPSDEYSIIGPPYYLYQHYGLDAAGLVKRVKKVLK